MIDIPYSLVIEATEDPEFFAFTRRIWRASPVWVIPSKIACIKPDGNPGFHPHSPGTKSARPPACSDATILIQNERKREVA